jgi:hypothetical protein
MAWFLYIICFIWLVVGLGLFLKGDKTQELIKRFFGDTYNRVFSFIPIVIGVLFIFSRGSVKGSWEWFPALMGILAIAKGLVFLFADEDESTKVISWWCTSPPIVSRLWGGMILIMAVSLYWAIA